MIARRCPVNEDFLRYGICEADCKNPFGYCPVDCKPAGCYCKANYVRYNGSCIPYEKCPSKLTISVLKQ